MIVLSTFKKVFIRNKKTTLLFLFGAVMSILMLAVSTAGMIAFQDMENSRSFSNLEDLYDITIITDIEINKFQMKNIVEKIDNAGVIFYGLQCPVDGFDKGMSVSTYIEYSKIDHQTFPVFKGEKFDIDNMINNNDYVMVGKELIDYTYEENGANYINITGQPFAIKAYIGEKRKNHFTNNCLVFNFSSIPDMVWLAKASSNRIQLKLFSPHNKSLENIEIISNEIKKLDSKAQIVSEKENVEQISFLSVFSALTVRGGYQFIYYTLLVYIVSVLNSISISTNWINERRYEIGVRKAFGHSHFNIFKMLYSEMLSIFIISGIIASLLYIFLIQLLQNSILRSLSFGIEIFIVSIIMIFVTSFITSLIPVIKTFSIEPKEAMQV